MWYFNAISASATPDTPNEVHTNNIYNSPESSTTSLSNGAAAKSRADIIANIKDSVVEIRTQYVVSKGQYIQSGAGSGVIVGDYEISDEDTDKVIEQGYHIITNAHVIADAVSSDKSAITVTLTDGTEYTASVIGSDEIGDIAILKIQETKELTCATFANEDYQLRVGDEVIAIGNPLGQLGGTVTNGYVSALDREIQIDGIKMNLLQTDAPINPGNSGGGLFNLRGELVGIVNAKSTGTDIEGLGFAIPSADAKSIYENFINLGYVENRPTLFVEYDMTYKYGVYVTKVLTRETGDNSSKLQLHDRICSIEIDGKVTDIISTSQLDSIISSLSIGQEVKLYIRRGVQYVHVTVKVYEFYI
ncbi:MAG: trypsin-like peptidase domain-containing protein [Clostridia bacterium]|nr:trypsin-like peptidase domain-containing protein [Clostridia bacterium]